MKTTLTIEEFRRMFETANQTIKARAEEFSRLDAALGDGDHGEAISTAFAVITRSAASGDNFKKMLSDMGFGVMLETSGSTSTLLGAFLLGMSDAAPAKTEVNADELRKMFRGAIDGVMKNTRAKVGDKTIMDALIPAVEAIEKTGGDDINAMLNTAAAAAVEGAEKTKNLVAKFGRGRNLGEKTIGHIDAGATSWASIFVSFAQAIQ